MSNVLFTLLPGTAGGDATSLASGPDIPSFGGLLLKTIVALVIVVVLAWVLLRWGLRRLVPGARPGAHMQVVARLPLDGRRQVVLVKAYGRYLLLGVADGSISLLRELSDAEVGVAEADGEQPPRTKFAEVLRRVLRREPTAPAAGEPTAEEDGKEDRDGQS